MAERSLGEVIDAIVRMPLDEQAEGRSHIDLIERTGYLQYRGEVSVDALCDRLARNPELVEAWQGWVDDNRGVPAWYFRPVGQGEYELGRIDRHLETTSRVRFDDRARVCAEYVYREIEQIAESALLWRRKWRLIPEVIARFRDGWRDRRDF